MISLFLKKGKKNPLNRKDPKDSVKLGVEANILKNSSHS